MLIVDKKESPMTVRPCVKLLTLIVTLIGVAGMFHAQPAAAASSTDRVIELINHHRRTIMGSACPSVASNPALMVAAQHHANDMAMHNYFSHTGRNGTSPWQRINGAGYNPRRAAENIAAGYESADATVARWMNSRTHRANILNCRLHEVGVGVAGNTNARYDIYWVLDFGTAH
jgi:uncharacterized protein YkwD